MKEHHDDTPITPQEALVLVAGELADRLEHALKIFSTEEGGVPAFRAPAAMRDMLAQAIEETGHLTITEHGYARAWCCVVDTKQYNELVALAREVQVILAYLNGGQVAIGIPTGAYDGVN